MDRIEQDYANAHYPRWRYHRTREARIVASMEQDIALGPEWADTPAAFYAPLVGLESIQVEESIATTASFVSKSQEKRVKAMKGQR